MPANSRRGGKQLTATGDQSVSINHVPGAPIVLCWYHILRFADDDVILASLLDTLIRVQQYWSDLGLEVEIVIQRRGSPGYEDPRREAILAVLQHMDPVWL
jgi:hypothetical protein